VNTSVIRVRFAWDGIPYHHPNGDSYYSAEFVRSIEVARDTALRENALLRHRLDEESGKVLELTEELEISRNAIAPLRRENEVLRSNSDHLSSENASLVSQVESMAMRIESLAEELAERLRPA